MVEMRRLTLADGLILIAICALAAGTRAGYLMACAGNASQAGPLRVETAPAELETLANNLRDHGRFASPAPFAAGEEETAHLAPGYPYLISAAATAARLVGSADRDRVLRWLQLVLGTLTAALYFLFARRAFRNRAVAILTGLLCALHPFWIIDTAALADGVTATFLLACALFLGARASQTSGPLTSLLYGLSLAALALVRAALLPFAFVALAWFLLRSRALTRGWLCALLAFLGFVNGLAPWTFRNGQLFGELLPIVDSAYLHLWIGNNPEATGGPASEQAMRKAPVEELSKIGRQTDRYARLGGFVAQEVRANPAEAVRRRSRAALNFIFGERWFTEGRLADRTGSDEAMPDWLAWSYPVVLESTLLGSIVLALLGWRWTYGWRSAAMPSSLALIWVPLPYVLSHAEALSGPRLPLDGVLLCYAAFTLACLFPGRQRLWAGEEAGGGESNPR
jgi:4-amino-4-deoxy-L-arabinose transferase-like glycosyltransferase